jgi:hypothetical protein
LSLTDLGLTGLGLIGLGLTGLDQIGLKTGSSLAFLKWFRFKRFVLGFPKPI